MDVEIVPVNGFITVTDSPASTTGSGLILPAGVDELDRGVVLHTGGINETIDLSLHSPSGQLLATQSITPGSLIYYIKDRAIMIADIKLVRFDAIVAYEKEAGGA